MTYEEWFDSHGAKHKEIVQKLIEQNFTEDEIIEYFVFENMVKNEPNFCELYKDNKKCHDLEYLNCYLCACPYFRFDDKGIKKVGKETIFSVCAIDCVDGSQFTYENKVHQDCSGCSIPHHQEYVKKHFHIDWKTIMKKCAPRK